MSRSVVGLALLLIGVDFLDELSSGIPFVSSPDIQADFGLGYGQAAGWLLTAMAVLGVVLEPPLLVLADRWPRKWFVCSGLAALGAVCAMAAWAPSYPVLVAALLLFGPASGVGVNAAQATLMDAHPRHRERMMVRWTLAGALGDLATPGFLLLCGLLGGGWRLGFAAVGALLIGYAALLWTRAFPRPVRDPDAPAPGGIASVRAALREPRLRAWVAAVLACELMDEILVAFGALYLRDHVEAGASVRAAILTAFLSGGVLGLFAAEAGLRRARPKTLLIVSTLACVGCYGAWLTATAPLASGVLMALSGFFAAMHYPLCQAQAYRALPQASGTVSGVLSAAGAIMLPIPLLLGWIADTQGLAWTLGLLLLQPAIVLGVAWRAARA